MHKVSILGVGIVGVLGCLLFLNTVQADQASLLEVKPKKCVALHRGQTCYQRVSFSWNLPLAGKYCLYQQGIEAALVCWEGKAEGRFETEFVSDKSEAYILRETATAQILGHAEVTLVWVYRTGRRSSSGWRLF